MTRYQIILLQIIGENGWDVFTHQMIENDGHLTRLQLNQALRSMLNKGEITQIEKGKYRRHHFTDEKVIGCFMVPDGGIAYWSALNMHGLTEQFPNELMIQNSARTGIKKIPGMGTTCRFIRVKPVKVTGYNERGYGNHRYSITDIEKTLVDCFDLIEYSGGFHELIKAFSQAHLNAKKMIRYSRIIRNLSAIKRIAFLYDLLEKNGKDEYVLFAINQVNERYTPFDPALPPTGLFIRKYHLILNIPETEILSMATPVRS